MNARTQITMDPDMQRRAHAKAAELGISFAEYIRRVVANDLGEQKPKVDVSVIFDLGASDVPTDIARDKHKMIGEALWDDHVRSVGGGFEEPSRRRSSRKP
jgi:hypothetical protein